MHESFPTDLEATETSRQLTTTVFKHGCVFDKGDVTSVFNQTPVRIHSMDKTRSQAERGLTFHKTKKVTTLAQYLKAPA